jgi:hypothetical protein
MNYDMIMLNIDDIKLMKFLFIMIDDCLFYLSNEFSFGYVDAKNLF